MRKCVTSHAVVPAPPPELPKGKLNLKQRWMKWNNWTEWDEITELPVISSPRGIQQTKSTKPQHLKCMEVLTQTFLEQWCKGWGENPPHKRAAAAVCDLEYIWTVFSAHRLKNALMSQILQLLFSFFAKNNLHGSQIDTRKSYNWVCLQFKVSCQ